MWIYRFKGQYHCSDDDVLTLNLTVAGRVTSVKNVLCLQDRDHTRLNI